MPEISRFFGIVIAMYHRDREPPHFHARYGSQKVVVRIADGYIEGKFPRPSSHPRVGTFTVKSSLRTGAWPKN